MKSCIVTVKYDVTYFLPDTWMEMTDEEIKEWLGDAPDFLDERLFFMDGSNIVHGVERIC